MAFLRRSGIGALDLEARRLRLRSELPRGMHTHWAVSAKTSANARFLEVVINNIRIANICASVVALMTGKSKSIAARGRLKLVVLPREP
jgi:hypothetical protein